jgi:antitoxin (DNA-binding transcriptional repressor) of toxin-antitoxin stability system
LNERAKVDLTGKRPYKVSMTTVTLTQARASLGKLCERARNGEEVGIIAGDRVIQLQPVEVRAVQPGEITIIPLDDEYLAREYGLTAPERRAFQKREKTRYARDKQAGRIRTFPGKFNPAHLD